MSTVIESPDGEIQYCQPISINKNNPYLQYQNNQYSNNFREIETDGRIVSISTETARYAINLQNKAGIVRFLCLLDFFINFITLFNFYYISVYCFIFAIISLLGYYSTYTFNRNGLIGYLIYQYIQTIYKLVAFILYISIMNNINLNDEIKKYNYYIVEISPILGSSLTVGKVYYLSSGGTWTLTNAGATSTSTGHIGIAVSTTQVCVRGYLRDTAYVFTTGDILYLKDSNGDISTTPPGGSGDVVKIIGYSIGGTIRVIYFNPSNDWIEIQ